MTDKTTGPFMKVSVNLTPQHRDMLIDYADACGETMSECLRRLIAEKFTQLQKGQS